MPTPQLGMPTPQLGMLTPLKGMGPRDPIGPSGEVSWAPGSRREIILGPGPGPRQESILGPGPGPRREIYVS
jgi:hypothetical protein